jgi:hypothetical protein
MHCEEFPKVVGTHILMGSWNLLENLVRTLQNNFSPGGFHKAILYGYYRLSVTLESLH